jgi:D-psicose/D-tagatose/L-ribulose 3-epimerase
MRFGINTFLFTSPFTNKSIRLFPLFKSWGFDSVEIALEDPADIDPVFINQVLGDSGLVCGSVCAAMGPGRDLRGTLQEQEAAVSYLKGVMDVLPVLGCRLLAGPLYSAVGRADIETADAYRQQWELVVKHLSALSAYAGQLGLTLAIEPLNRYETDFINTADQALKMIDAVGSNALRLHLDTFHMNIEEKDQIKAILQAGSRLGHFHACGTDRGTPGRDHIQWDLINTALQQIGYTGDIVIESFTPDVKIIAKAASIWRQIEHSKESIAADGLEFLRSHIQLS